MINNFPKAWLARLSSIILICMLVSSGFASAQTPVAVESLAEIIDQIDAARRRFDRCYFEYDARAEHDAQAREHGWGKTASIEWLKIARDGEKRYSHRKSVSAPDAKVKYADRLIVSTWDGVSLQVFENGELKTFPEKRLQVEENHIFFTLGWPVNEFQEDPEQVFVPRAFRDPAGKWELSTAVLDGVDCYVISSEVRQMRFWFDKTTKMPRKYELQRSPYWPNNQTREFLEYQTIADDGTQFPQKIIISGDLYSPTGSFQGTFKTQFEIASSSLAPDAQLFVLKEQK